MQQLVITRQEDKIVSSLFEQQELIQVHVEQGAMRTILGNVYVGKVKNIVKNIRYHRKQLWSIRSYSMCIWCIRRCEYEID